MKTPYEKLANDYTNCSGQMTKMATMPIYGKTHIQIFFARRSMTMGLGM